MQQATWSPLGVQLRVQHQVFIPKTKFKNLEGKGVSKTNETMKSWPGPYFWQWKINVQQIKPSVAGVCWKSKNWHKRWKQQCSACVQKKAWTIKSELPQRTVNHILFIPPSFRSHIVSMPCWHGKCQSFQRWHIFFFEVTALHVTPRICPNPSWTKGPKIHH